MNRLGLIVALLMLNGCALRQTWACESQHGYLAFCDIRAALGEKFNTNEEHKK